MSRAVDYAVIASAAVFLLFALRNLFDGRLGWTLVMVVFALPGLITLRRRSQRD